MKKQKAYRAKRFCSLVSLHGTTSGDVVVPWRPATSEKRQRKTTTMARFYLGLNAPHLVIYIIETIERLCANAAPPNRYYCQVLDRTLGPTCQSVSTVKPRIQTRIGMSAWGSTYPGFLPSFCGRLGHKYGNVQKHNTTYIGSF